MSSGSFTVASSSAPGSAAAIYHGVDGPSCSSSGPSAALFPVQLTGELLNYTAGSGKQSHDRGLTEFKLLVIQGIKPTGRTRGTLQIPFQTSVQTQD